MKKFLLSAAAAGALAFGGAASAQDLGTVLGAILNAQPQYNSVYVDQYGRQVYVDQNGRHLILDQHGYYNGRYYGTRPLGRPGIGLPESEGQVNVAPGTLYSYGYRQPNDRDGDGIANWNDRWPDDPRYR